MKKESIKALRKKIGLDCVDFGKLFETKGRTVESWEQGLRNPNQLALRLLDELDALTKKGGDNNEQDK